MTFYLKGHQNYQGSRLKFLISLFLLSKVVILNIQLAVVLLPLEIKHRTVPHLEALTRSIECRSGHWRGSTFSSATLL